MLNTVSLCGTTKSREAVLRRPQPIAVIVVIPALNDMKRIHKPAVRAAVALAAVQHVAVDEDERASRHLLHGVLLLALALALVIAGPVHLRTRRKARAVVALEGRAALRPSHKALAHRRAAVRPARKAQRAIVGRGVLEGEPEADGGGRVGVQEGAVLVGGHGAADARLLADQHALQAARVGEAQSARERRVAWVHGRGAERAGRAVEAVPDLVDCPFLRLCECAARVEGVFLEEEPDLVARGQEVVVANVVFAVLACREFGEWVVGEVEGCEHRVRFREEGGHGFG